MKRLPVFLSVLAILTLALAACQAGNTNTANDQIPQTGASPEPTVAGQRAVQPTAFPTPADTLSAGVSAVDPSVTVADQSGDGGKLVIGEVVSSGPGWLVIHADNNGKPGTVLGFAPVNDGANADVVVQIDDSEATPVLHAMLHVDAGVVGEYEFPGPDAPAMMNGQMVSPTFSVSDVGGNSGKGSGGSDDDEYGTETPEAGDDDGTPDQGSGDATMAPGANEGMIELRVAESDELGKFLTDQDGMTLYLFTKDEPGVSNCKGGCLEAWPPLLVDDLASVRAGDGVDQSKIGVIAFEGEAGKYLVTYDQMPLYYWQNDVNPGDTTGQGVNDVWFVVEP